VLSGEELDVQIAVERLGDAEQRVDARRPATALEPGDRRLRRVSELGELALRESPRAAPFGDTVGDLREEPSAVPRDDPLV
jgi:hypothetical protein